MVEIIFGADKKHRDKYFSAGSFAHPAKMMLPLQRWLIEKYSKPGDVILDPMAGQGTLLISCTMGRHVIMVELESKFVQMQNDNWTKIQTLGPEMGYSMGTATILQGDARKLPGVLADVVITSPPYADTAARDRSKEASYDREKSGQYPKHGDLSISRGYQADVIVSSPPFSEAKFDKKHGLKDLTSKGMKGRKAWANREDNNPTNPENIANLPYGKLADVIMTSPPYAETGASGNSRSPFWERLANDPTSARYGREHHPSVGEGYSADPSNLGNLPYGNIDCVITSPPYEEGGGHGGKATKCALEHKQPSMGQFTENLYSSRPDNIGNLKGESYLSAMLEVYQGCCRALRPQGLMILVTKNFIREKQEIRLDLDTIKLCEQAGFQFVERHYRKLTSQSFWRTIYRQKYPDAPVLNKEDILVFKAT